ncbi:MAG: glutathione S-transferase family protein [Aestuariibacter sp.]
MKLYTLELSGHGHRAQLMASLLHLKNVEIVLVDLPNGEHKQPEFLAKNPFGQVPVLEDGETVVGDSNAILIYLASQFDTTQRWYPDSPNLMSEIQFWLSKASNELANGPARARLISVFNAPYDAPATIEAAHQLLKIIDTHLSNRQWLVGKHPTIADVAMYSYIAHAPEGGVDLACYQQILKWLAFIEDLPGFIPMPKTETKAKSELVA